MSTFTYRDRSLYCEETPVASLADQFGTPLYVYSSRSFQDGLTTLQTEFRALDPLVCYSVKANSNLGVLQLMAQNGSGFDVVSGGELRRVLKAGGRPNEIVFAGVGKTDDEIAEGLRAGVLMFNVESEAELQAIDQVASAVGRTAPIALRVNPDVDPKTHRYITTGKKESKFGMDIERALRASETVLNLQEVSMIGLHMHIGSQITTAAPYADAAKRAAELIGQLRAMGHQVQWCNMGGGFGIDYRDGEALPVAAFAEVVVPTLRGTGCRIALEPGRSIAGNSGILVSRVIYTKESGEKRFIIQDAAMNDLIRPALYEGYHQIWPLEVPSGFPIPPQAVDEHNTDTVPQDVVGPICESGDILALDRLLPPLQRGDLLATFSAGAYGMVMASNYNTRPRAAEVLVEGSEVRLIRRRETFEDLIGPELVGLESLTNAMEN